MYPHAMFPREGKRIGKIGLICYIVVVQREMRGAREGDPLCAEWRNFRLFRENVNIWLMPLGWRSAGGEFACRLVQISVLVQISDRNHSWAKQLVSSFSTDGRWWWTEGRPPKQSENLLTS